MREEKNKMCMPGDAFAIFIFAMIIACITFATIIILCCQQ